MKKLFHRQTNVIDTVVVIVVIAVLFLTAFVQISRNLRGRSFSRMEEAVKTVMDEVASKLERDSSILNATADILAATNFAGGEDELDVDSLLETIKNVEPLFDTMNIRVLLPDERVLLPNGQITDVSSVDSISFAREAPLGEHVSNRVESMSGD